jgi:hypothetical protein
MLNRAAMIVRPAQPFTDWVMSLGDSGLLPDPNGEQTVYLVPEYGSDEDTVEILKEIYQDIFESELYAWSEDEGQWPKDRGLDQFKLWFTVEFHSIVEDLCDYDLTDEDPEDDEE